jgi:hypothetical protein
MRRIDTVGEESILSGGTVVRRIEDSDDEPEYVPPIVLGGDIAQLQTLAQLDEQEPPAKVFER